MTESRLQTLIRGRNVVFITVKNKDYIRVVQLSNLLDKYAGSYRVVASEKKNPIARALDLNKKIRKMDFSDTDVVLAGFLPQLIWGSLKRRTLRYSEHIVYCADFFLSLYDTVVLDRKYVSQSKVAAKILKKMDKKVLDEAELVITDTKADAEFFAKEYEINDSKFEVLYLWADGIMPQIKSVGIKEGKTKVIYFGTGLPLQGTDIVLKAFNELSENEEFECTYVGSTKEIPLDVVDNVRKHYNVNIISWMDQDKLLEMINRFDICLAGHFNPDIDKADRTIPGKAFIYEALNKTMILGDTRANREIFKEDERHFFVKRGDVKVLVECVYRIACMKRTERKA